MRSRSSSIIRPLLAAGLLTLAVSPSLAAGSAASSTLRPAASDRDTPNAPRVAADLEADLRAALFKATLAETFGERSIHRVFDAGTGKGDWMRTIRRQPWLAPNAVIVGSELEIQKTYGGEPMVFPDSDWEGLTVVHSSSDSRYPSQGSLDLLHEAFWDARPARGEQVGGV